MNQTPHNRLKAYLQNNRWHPCLLIQNGNTDLQKQEVRQLVQMVFCQKKTSDPCGQCRDCRKIEMQSHPDFFWVEESKFESIKIDTIRELISNLQLSPVEKEFRLVVIWQAESLNSAAANALLKSLEEPKENRFYWLITPYAQKIISTIRSRSLFFSLGNKREWQKDATLLFNADALNDRIESLKEKEEFQDFLVQLQSYFREEVKNSGNRRALQGFDECVTLESRLQSNANASLMLQNFVRNYFQ